MTTKQMILSAVEEQKIQFIALWFTDITGIVKSVMLPAVEFEAVIDHGLHFDGSAIEGFARVAESDMLLMPDLSTFTALPWTPADERTARVMCTVHTPGGEAFIGDPRTALIKALKQAEEMGYLYKTGMELEFFLFQMDENRRPIVDSPYDIAGYYDMPDDPVRSIRRKILSTLTTMGIGVDSTHSEIGSGQHEIDFQYDDALVSADSILTARVVLRAVAGQNDLYCTFMPRPSNSLPGSGMHTHQTLHDLESGRNEFVDLSKPYGLSDIARYFLAGQLEHARAMCAILAPLVNSYKRLGTTIEAPVHVTWAHVNRGALIRVPSISPGKEAHIRLELRCPDPSSNPYLANAVMLMAGLDGIRRKLPLPDPGEETFTPPKWQRKVEILPTSLGEALDALSQDDVILGALGPFISDRYLAAKRQEYEEYNRQVTQWEIDRYLNRF